MIYFKDCTTIEQVKTRYKTLAKQFHPDCGGDTQLMQALNTEYELACSAALKGEGLTTEETQDEMKVSEEYRRVIEQIISLPAIKIELVGDWIWVTGSTYPVRKELRAAGLFYASKKAAWYYRAEEYKTTGSKKTLDEIREKYGSEQVNRSRRTNVIEH